MSAKKNHSRFKPVLSDHKTVRKKLIPPIKQLEGGLETIEWLDAILPEIVWIALLQEKLTVERSIEICTIIGRVNSQIIEKLSPFDDSETNGTEDKPVDLVLISHHSLLSDEQYLKFKNILKEKGVLKELVDALYLLLELYPQCPLRRLEDNSINSFLKRKIIAIKEILLDCVLFRRNHKQKKLINEFKFFLKKYFYRRAHLTNLVEATASCMTDLSGRFRYTNGLVPPDYNILLTHFPDSDKYKREAALIRARTLGIFMLRERNKEWSNYFWARGLQLDECE